MLKNELTESVKLITNFTKTKDFYNTLKAPLDSETPVSQSTFNVLKNSDPKAETSKWDVEKRGTALKILERIDVSKPENYEFLHQIIICDDTTNVILAIKCIQTFYNKKILPQEDFCRFLDTVCKKVNLYIKEFYNEDFKNSIQFMNMFAFVFDLTKIYNNFNQSVNDLILEIEKCTTYFMQLEVKAAAKKNQMNYNLFKFLNFVFELNRIYKKDQLIGSLISYLVANVNDESKELLNALYSKLSVMAEKNNNLIEDYSFFIKSNFLDTKSNGIRNLLKILKFKENTKTIQENLQIIIINSIEELFYSKKEVTENELKIVVSLLDSLIVVNKLFSKEAVSLLEKKNFRRTSFIFIINFLDRFTHKLKYYAQVSETVPAEENENIIKNRIPFQDIFSSCLNSILKNIEDHIAFNYGFEKFTLDIPPLSNKDLFYDDYVFYERMMANSFDVFTVKFLRVYLERYFAIFLYSSFHTFYAIIRKFSGRILTFTYVNSFFYDVWNVFLDNIRSAAVFSSEIYTIIISKYMNKEFKRNLNLKRYNEEYYDLLTSPVLMSNDKELLTFHIKALNKILMKDKHTSSQLEKIITSIPFYSTFEINLEILNCLFMCIKPCYNDFTILPKFIYEKVTFLLDFLKFLHVKNPSEEIYIKVALNVPLSLTLILQHFSKLSYFLAEGIKSEGEIKAVCYNLLEKSLDTINTEILLSISEDILEKITSVLLYDSIEGTFALAATQILAKYHSALKIFINHPFKVIDSIYPSGIINLKFEFDNAVKSFNVDFLIFKAINKIRGEFIKDTSPNVYSITSQLFSFKTNTSSVRTDDLSKKIILAFLYDSFGWANFEDENIYTKVVNDLKSIMENDYMINNSLITQLSSHQSRIKNINHSQLLRHQQYIYDALISLFVLKEEDFLFCVYDVVFTYKIIHFFKFKFRKRKAYFNYNVLLQAFYESFSTIETSDYILNSFYDLNISSDEAINFFYENKKYLFSKELFNPVEQLEKYVNDFSSYKILQRVINLKKEVMKGMTKIMQTNFFDEMLLSFTSLSFYKDEDKQKSSILGLATLLVLMKDEKEWIYRNFSFVSASMLFCMSEPNPVYKNLIFLIFQYMMYITSEFNIQLKEQNEKDDTILRVGFTTDMFNLQKLKTLPRKNIIEQLFNSLSSKHKKLRIVSLQVLIYYSEIKEISLKNLLGDFIDDFYINLKNKYSNSNSHMKLGFFDCLLFLNKVVPFKKNSAHLSHIANIVMNNQFIFYYDNILLLLRARKFIIDEIKSEELIHTNIDFIVKNISNPIFESDKIINASKDIINASNNPIMFQKLFKKSFIFYFADKNNFKHFSSTVKSIVKIFPSYFVEDLILMSIPHLTDYYDEASSLSFELLFYLEKIPENIFNIILHYFSTMPCKVDESLLQFLNKHFHFLEYMMFNCKEVFVYLLLKNVILTIKEREDYKILYNNIYTIILRTNILNSHITEKLIHFCILASLFNYDFKTEELLHLFKYYIRTLYSYFNEFYELNKNKLKDIPLPNDFLLKKSEEEDKASKLFEQKVYDEEFINKLGSKNDYSFSEICYLAMFKPSVSIYKSLFFYDESASRILDVFKNIEFTNEINDAIIYTFESTVSYRIHLMILMPLLIDHPSLINKQILPKVLEIIYRLFGTNSFQHKFTAGRLLYACSLSVKEKDTLNNLFTQYFNFCIKCNDKEYFSLFKRFDLKLTNEFDFNDVNNSQLAMCLDFLLQKREEEKRKSLKKLKKIKKNDTTENEIYLRMFNQLLPHLNDTIFYQSFLPFITPEQLTEFISNPTNHPKISYYSILQAYKERLPIEEIILNTFESLIEMYKDSRNDLLFMNFNELIIKYPYNKELRFLKVLGLLTELTDEYFIYEQAIDILESMSEKENIMNFEMNSDLNKNSMNYILKNYFFNHSVCTESFLNFLIYIFRNDQYSYFYEHLKPLFVKGLECKFIYLRDEFHHLLKETLPRDKRERVIYLLGMDWNLFEDNFVYTFLRLLLDEELSFNLLKQYCTGEDNFYEDIYKKVERSDEKKPIPNPKDNAAIMSFKNVSQKYKPENVTKLILEFCYNNKEVCVRILTGYLKSLDFKDLKDNFRLFALNLNVSRFNSYLVDNLFSVFNYLLLNVRVKHNCYFSNIVFLEDEEKYLIYKLTNEIEYYLGGYNSLFYHTNLAIKEILVGNFDAGRLYLQRSLELINEDNFNEKESTFLEDIWKYAMKHLCQWDSLLELAIQTNDSELEAEISFLIKETGSNFLETVCRMNDSLDKFVYESVNTPFDQDTDSLLFLAQVELSQIPFFTPKFTKILNFAQLIIEMKELQMLSKENLSDQRSLWSKREPLFNENILNWIFYFSWRNKLFNFINKDDNVIFLQELATTMNKITSLSRRMNYIDMADFFNQLIFSTPNIRSSDAFSKVVEEIEIFIQRNDYESALRKAKTTNISYFSNEQRGIILYYIAKLERNNNNFNNASQVYTSNSKNWNEWGMYLEEKNGEIVNIFSCFINASLYATKESHKYFIKCIKYFNSEKVYEILKDNISNIDPMAFIPYLTNLERMFIDTRNKCAELCLVTISEIIPQTCFRMFRIQVPSNKPSNNVININSSNNVINNNNNININNNNNINNNAGKKEEESPLYKLYQDLRFENNRSKLGLVMVISLCSSRILITHEQLAYSCLERIFYSCPNKLIIKNIDLHNTFTRMLKCVGLTNWNIDLTKEFFDDFENYRDSIEFSPSSLLMKCYKWLSIIENILNTYISSHDLDLSTCRLIDNLLEYELVLFGKNEFNNKVLIDHFLPISTFYMTERLMSRTLTIIGSDGREYLYLTQKNQKNQFLYEESILSLLELLSKDLKNSVKCFNCKLNYKSIIYFSPNFDLLLFEEPFILLSIIYEENMKKSLRKMILDYLKIMERVSGCRIKGLENMDVFMNEEYINDKIGNCINNKNNHIKESKEDSNYDESNDNLCIMNDLKNESSTLKKDTNVNSELYGNTVITKEHRLKAFNKIQKSIDNKILLKGFTELYGSSAKFFLFRKKFTANYAALSCVNKVFKFLQLIPAFTGLSLFSGTLKVTIFDLEHTSNELYRLSPNMVNLMGKEGLEGLFISSSDSFSKFLLENEFIKDFLELFTKLSYSEFKGRLDDLIDGKVKNIIEKSMNPNELCDVDIAWYPWL